MSRSLNKVMIIGNLTNDPELRYTPQGHSVTSFGVATNRVWNDPNEGTQRESVEFHNVVAWNKLAELCTQLLKKGHRVYIEGRLQTRTWDDEKGMKRYKTEVVCEEMILLQRKGEDSNGDSYSSSPASTSTDDFDISDFDDSSGAGPSSSDDSGGKADSDDTQTGESKDVESNEGDKDEDENEDEEKKKDDLPF